jgi:hypothetical protein
MIQVGIYSTPAFAGIRMKRIENQHHVDNLEIAPNNETKIMNLGEMNSTLDIADDFRKNDKSEKGQLVAIHFYMQVANMPLNLFRNSPNIRRRALSGIYDSYKQLGFNKDYSGENVTYEVKDSPVKNKMKDAPGGIDYATEAVIWANTLIAEMTCLRKNLLRIEDVKEHDIYHNPLIEPEIYKDREKLKKAKARYSEIQQQFEPPQKSILEEMEEMNERAKEKRRSRFKVPLDPYRIALEFDKQFRKMVESDKADRFRKKKTVPLTEGIPIEYDRNTYNRDVDIKKLNSELNEADKLFLNKDLYHAIKLYENATLLPVESFRNHPNIRKRAMKGLFESYKKLGFNLTGSGENATYTVKEISKKAKEKEATEGIYYASTACRIANTLIAEMTFLKDKRKNFNEVTYEDVFMSDRVEPEIYKERQKLWEANAKYREIPQPDEPPQKSILEEMDERDKEKRHRRITILMDPKFINPDYNELSKNITGIDMLVGQGKELISGERLREAQSLFTALFNLPVKNYDDGKSGYPNISGIKIFQKVCEGLVDTYSLWEQKIQNDKKLQNDTEIQKHLNARSNVVNILGNRKMELIRDRDYEVDAQGDNEEIKKLEKDLAEQNPYYLSPTPYLDEVRMTNMMKKQ